MEPYAPSARKIANTRAIIARVATDDLESLRDSWKDGAAEVRSDSEIDVHAQAACAIIAEFFDDEIAARKNAARA